MPLHALLLAAAGHGLHRSAVAPGQLAPGPGHAQAPPHPRQLPTMRGMRRAEEAGPGEGLRACLRGGGETQATVLLHCTCDNEGGSEPSRSSPQRPRVWSPAKVVRASPSWGFSTTREQSRPPLSCTGQDKGTAEPVSLACAGVQVTSALYSCTRAEEGSLLRLRRGGLPYQHPQDHVCSVRDSPELEEEEVGLGLESSRAPALLHDPKWL
jgi:hypothetical protein